MEPIYKDKTKTPEERTEDLLSRMTVREKFAQLRLMKVPTDRQKLEVIPDEVWEENIDRCGQLYNNGSMSPANYNRLQKWALEKTRLGIPVIVHGESLHGLFHKDGVVFPQGLGLASAFDKAQHEKVAEEIGREAAAAGIHMTYAPNLDISRDPRWGRVEENYGEDPYLTGELGLAYIRGFQKSGSRSCPKHYAGHGSPERGINLGPVHYGLREFYEIMFPAFEKAVGEGKPGGVMPAYHSWDGVPVHASRFLLTELLRDRLGFEGTVVSDYGAIKMFQTFHKTAPDPETAGRMAMTAGVDVECRHPFGFGPELEAAAERGDFPMETVDRAVRRELLLKFRLGLFDDPYIPEDPAPFRSAGSLALARKSARDGAVLLKNEGALLPLSGREKIALIGPNADNAQLGGYTASSAMAHAVTLRRALEERLGDGVSFHRGCTIAGGSDEAMEDAVNAARAADVAILVLGDNSNYYGGIGWGDAETDGSVAVTCGEGFDQHTLDLPGRQEELLEKVCATGTPVVLILETGRPYAVVWAKEHVPAILQAWYPGEQGGYALAELLLGDASPCGRLPVSFPRSVGHLPCFYNRKPSAGGYYHKPGSPEAPGRDYVFDAPEPLFRFGDGLSYTSFAYSDLTLSREKGGADEPLTVSVTVENTGAFPSGEAVLLYVTDDWCRISPFVEQLKGFEKIFLAPGEKKTVSFTLDRSAFSFINEEMRPEVEPGAFTIRVGELTASYTIG